MFFFAPANHAVDTIAQVHSFAISSDAYASYWRMRSTFDLALICYGWDVRRDAICARAIWATLKGRCIHFRLAKSIDFISK